MTLVLTLVLARWCCCCCCCWVFSFLHTRRRGNEQSSKYLLVRRGVCDGVMFCPVCRLCGLRILLCVRSLRR
ncbi:uncharacterized protein GGS25DRAFT_401889 [Hypoxylon fragiforme]|uniref:uncharacterized protein n=1 Tax=Hypoxylon fragiforme TaxID=63214 RepID=UPI0020C6DC36|nr:uncharacterized protein GGS25DRAFT_401889 [Hypoxylon fragiforme]KAI2604871.1 hypothetical protein GGS25DRAFT_401889 [Hypoxylon fragiforme]